MRMYDIIAKKRDGGALTEAEIGHVISGCVDGSIPDYQLSAWLMAVCLRGMTERETAALTLQMARSGDMVDLSSLPGVKVDKHSTGGVGDKTTLIAAPVAAALGVTVAKMSGRGLGFTGGTVDKLESIPGLRTGLSRAEFFSAVRRAGLSVVGQSGNLVPADKKLYALRDVTATVESIPLIASSIMSKKLAAGADCILLDVKTGSGAFMKTEAQARALARAMVEIGVRAGRKTVALVTDMDRPLGRAIGNALEVGEACDTLCGRGPEDLTALCVELAANMALLAGVDRSLDALRECARAAIASGAAFERLLRMAAAQGGDTSVLKDPQRLPKAGVCRAIPAPRDGYVTGFDTAKCGTAAMLLGAGRETKESPIDHGAGLVLQKTLGDAVRGGEPLAYCYASHEEKCLAAEELFLEAVRLGEHPPAARPLVLGRITEEGEA